MVFLVRIDSVIYNQTFKCILILRSPSFILKEPVMSLVFHQCCLNLLKFFSFEIRSNLKVLLLKTNAVISEK